MANPARLAGLSNMNFFAFMKVFYIDAWIVLFIATVVCATGYTIIKSLQESSYKQKVNSFLDS